MKTLKTLLVVAALVIVATQGAYACGGGSASDAGSGDASVVQTAEA